MIFTGAEIVATLCDLGISHVVWVPDSELGRWESDLESSPIELLRVCREGEAWPLAAGLHVGGQRPLVVMQTTGMFESGDALRNVIYDMKLPLFALIGARNWLQPTVVDSAKTFAKPLLDAWHVNYVVIESRADRVQLGQHYVRCQAACEAGMVLLAE